MKNDKLIGQQRKISEAQKKKIAGRQKYKCANEPDKELKYLENYECPFWKQPGKDCGSFDESGYEIDHIIEVSMGGTDAENNLQALCLPCHMVKTKNFMMDESKRKQRKLSKNKLKIKKNESNKYYSVKEIVNESEESGPDEEIVNESEESGPNELGSVVNNKNKLIVPICFGEKINIKNKFTEKDIIRAIDGSKGSVIGLIRLLHFNPKLPEYHNIFKTSKTAKYSILTKDGIKYTDNVVEIIGKEIKTIVPGTFFLFSEKQKIKHRGRFDEEFMYITTIPNEISYPGCNKNFRKNRELFLKNIFDPFLFDERKIVMDTLNICEI